MNASLFGIVSAFFLQPLPVEDPDELVLVLQRSDAWRLPHGHSYPDYREYREASGAFAELAAFTVRPVHLSAPGERAERAWVQMVSPNYFELARVRAEVGQLFDPARGEAPDPQLVLTHRYWQRRFGGDPGIVGRTLVLNGSAFTVVGVTPESFRGLWWGLTMNAFVPAGSASLLAEGGEAILEARGFANWRLMGRLRPNMTLGDARADVAVVAQRLAAEYPDSHQGARVVVMPETSARPDPTFSDFTPIFTAIFLAMVGLVLFVACANVANLMLSRAIDRRRDFVLRAALGASRWRLIRLQVMESLLLALAAGLLGVLLSRLVGWGLSGLMPSGGAIPIDTEHPSDWRVYAFTAVISLLAGLGTGLWPALRASRFELVEALKEGGSRVGAARHALRNLLVVGQVALSLVVLVCAALFTRSLGQLRHTALGFRSDHLLMTSLDLGMQQYDDSRGRRFLERLLERAEALPGVRSATLSRHIPFDYDIQLTRVSSEGDVPSSEEGDTTASYDVVGLRYFETAGLTLRRGRVFAESDDENAPAVAIVNETMAHTLWPQQDPIGQRFRIGRDGEWTRVVGLVNDGKYIMIAEEPRLYFYVPLAQRYRSPMTLMIWSETDPSALVAPLQQLMAELDPELPTFNLRTMEYQIRDSMFGLAPLRYGAALAAVQGLVALLLAVMGLYAVVAYAVSQRTHEIGVRMALGARRGSVVWLVMRQAMRFTAVGVALGLVGAVGIGLGLSRVLYGVEPMSGGVFAGITTLLLAVSAVACLVPARRATRVDPLDALRYE